MVKKDIILFLESHKKDIYINYNISKLGLFGSFAREEATNKSDIDILYDLDDSVTDILQLKKKFKKYLENELHRSIDLCRIKYMKPFVREIIEKEAIYV